MISELTNHLWQSTLFVVVVAVLAVVFRKNLAQIRYWLWLSASLKFLVPFSLLATLGSHLAPPTWKIAKQVAAPAVSFAIEQIARPFPDSPSFVPAAQRDENWIIVIPVILGVWLCGFLVIALIRFKGWLQNPVRRALKHSAEDSSGGGGPLLPRAARTGRRRLRRGRIFAAYSALASGNYRASDADSTRGGACA